MLCFYVIVGGNIGFVLVVFATCGGIVVAVLVDMVVVVAGLVDVVALLSSMWFLSARCIAFNCYSCYDVKGHFKCCYYCAVVVPVAILVIMPLVFVVLRKRVRVQIGFAPSISN